MNDKLQDDALAKADLKLLERLQAERAPYESVWREIDDHFPDGAGGFNKLSPGGIRGDRLFDITHIDANDRFAAAGVAITTPEEKQYIHPVFSDPELMKLRSVQVWCEQAGDRIYAIRHAPHTGFVNAAFEDWGQLGRYGTSPMWVDAIPGVGMFYRALHLSEVFIDVDFAGMVNTVPRKTCKTAQQCADFFGLDSISPKMREAVERDKGETEFELLQVIAPNRQRDPEALDWRRFPIAGRWLALDEKFYVERKGWHSMPVAVSRHTTSPGEKYGRSPGIKTLPTAKGLQAMRRTTLRAAHKAVDPALVFYDDDGLTSIATRPGGLNRGFVDENGKPLIHRMPGGEQGLPFAENEAEQERAVIRKAFLEEFYKLLTDPTSSRRTTTEVMEIIAKEGALVRPYASRYATEKQNPVSQRELDLMLRARQLPPLPPEVVEAGAWPRIEYENMLAEAARAESVSKGLRFIETITPLAANGENSQVMDWIDEDAMIPGLARDIGVRPSWIRDPKAVAALRQQRSDAQQAQAGAEQLGQVADAYKSIAQGNAIGQAA